MKNLFAEFKPVDYETWLAQIKKDLKDKPLEVLISQPEKDIEINAFYHPEKDQFQGPGNTHAIQSHRPTNEWSIRRCYQAGDNKKILRDLNEGIDAVGLKASDDELFKKDVSGILFEHIAADVQYASKQAAMEIDVPENARLNFDVIALNLRSGEMRFSLEDFFEFYQAKPHHKTIWIDGAAYGDAGATTIMELAFVLGHLNEYVQFLKSKGESLETINKKITIEFSVNENYFVNLAKFRAARELVALLFSGYDDSFESIPLTIYGKTGQRYLAVNDANNNLLRATTQAMSAILGGCDALTITLPETADKNQRELNLRMAKNIQLVLREESYFDKVVDASAGSYYLESLTDQLIEKAWKLFLDTENRGGLMACLQNNVVQDAIDENRNYLIDQLNSGKKTFLGINKFQSRLEKWTEPAAPENAEKTNFRRLAPFRLESFYTQKTSVS